MQHYFSRVLVFTMACVAIVFASCEKEKSVSDDVLKIPVDLKIQRFDERFAQATVDSLPQLMQQFPYLFPDQYDMNFWQERITDTLQEHIDREVAEAFSDFETETQDLELLFKHIKYYYPNYSVPEVVTVTSFVDHKNRVILNDSLLLISLDVYLGADHEFYKGIQKYFSQNFRPEQIDVDVASAFAKRKLGKPSGRQFIDEMIQHGKRLYIIERLLPLKAKNEIIAYTPDQLEWAEKNEVNIWTNFVENEVLFDTDPKLLQRFMNPAPFSKFYMEFDNETPPRLGRYIGWQIVRSYMDKNDISLQMLASRSSDEIFKNAGYKPKK